MQTLMSALNRLMNASTSVTILLVRMCATVVLDMHSMLMEEHAEVYMKNNVLSTQQLELFVKLMFNGE